MQTQRSAPTIASRRRAPEAARPTPVDPPAIPEPPARPTPVEAAAAPPVPPDQPAPALLISDPCARGQHGRCRGTVGLPEPDPLTGRNWTRCQCPVPDCDHGAPTRRRR